MSSRQAEGLSQTEMSSRQAEGLSQTGMLMDSFPECPWLIMAGACSPINSINHSCQAARDIDGPLSPMEYTPVSQRSASHRDVSEVRKCKQSHFHWMHRYHVHLDVASKTPRLRTAPVYFGPFFQVHLNCQVQCTVLFLVDIN